MERGNRMSSGLIIVVDDNPSFRKLYSDFLSVHGYTVMTARSGAQGMKLLLNCTPKVLILDISMPGMDGIETCKQIRKIHGNDIPILFLTAFTDIDNLRACLHAGEIAEAAEFFSFGTNDLTQATFSLSREDAEKKFLSTYRDHGILQDNPF